MQKLPASNKIYISQSKIPKAERGVFARVGIKNGEIIERCPVIIVSRHDTSNLKESILVTYFFYFGKSKERLAIALGFGSIYDHSYEPNATYKIKVKEKLIDFVALKDIKKDEEITVNYNFGNPKDKSPLWFNATTPSK
jgi:SET domain-containing protein